MGCKSVHSHSLRHVAKSNTHGLFFDLLYPGALENLFLNFVPYFPLAHKAAGYRGENLAQIGN